MQRLVRAITVAVASGGLVLAGIAVAGPATAASTGVVINEAYGGGGNSGATYTNDFVELQNRGATPVDLSGWSVQYHSKATTGSWQATPLTGTLAPGALYLVQEGKGPGGTTALPSPDATGSIAMSATDGTVALVQGADPLTCATSADCATASVDLLGFGAAAIAEGTPATGATNTASMQRVAGADTDVNSTDFAAGAPTPKADNATGTGGGGGTPPTPGDVRIHDIQGDSWVSPRGGTTVANVPGIVTGVRATGSSRGYWIQDPTPDADPTTSEGIFVYTGSAPAVALGDSVLVSGTVKDFYTLADGDTLATTSNLSTTEIQSTAVYVVSHGNPLPAPIVLTPTTVPDLYAPDLGGANIETTGIHPTRSALDFYESIEGMRAEVDDARVVGPSNKYGETYITTKPDQAVSARGGTLLTGENQTPSGRLEVVPTDGSDPEANVGDVFTGATTGPIDWSSFGGYLIAATQLGPVAAHGLTPSVATRQASDQLAVATYNVENLAPSDPADKYSRLAQGIVANLASPDVVAVEEVQDNDGATDSGTVAADQTLQKLTAAIAAAGGPFYQWREIDPVNDQDGGQPGGNIRVAFLFNPARVSFVDSGAASVDRSTTGTAVTKTRGDVGLTLSPGRIDPTNSAWESSRKPLVGEFRFRGQEVFVIGNHFDSKLGDQNADGRFQYPEQSSAVQRKAQATEVNAFVGSLLKADRNAKVVVAGDLNDYQFSPALQTLTGSGKDQILTDLITTLPKNEQYTYVYDGVSEVLDHILVTKGAGRVQYQVVHLNAEFANQVSDHDPQLVRLTIAQRPTLPVCTPDALALGYTDALNKLQYKGTTVGGLSSLAYDARAHSWISAVDNHAGDPSRIWFIGNPAHPTVTRAPLVLTKPDGTPYDGTTADNEGLAVLPSGDYLVSSETEPSIRIFGRDGVQKTELPVPARFAVTGTAPDGQATANATLEGLTISPDGRTVIAAMEGALSGDVSASGDATLHRFLVYTAGTHGWTLSKQIAYRAEAGQRIPEVAAYGKDSLIVEEASYSPVTGNAVALYGVTGLAKAADVSGVANLSTAPASVVVAKKLVANLQSCPTLGATALEPQANPLLDNFEGMAITGSLSVHGLHGAGISLISDDNFSATQRTRILNLVAKLP
jgi:predicted extracellular nuclease